MNRVTLTWSAGIILHSNLAAHVRKYLLVQNIDHQLVNCGGLLVKEYVLKMWDDNAQRLMQAKAYIESVIKANA